MQWKLDFVPEQQNLFSYRDSFLFMGSCFAQKTGDQMKRHGLSVLVNPFGILFNPVSIANAIRRIVDKEEYQKEELVEKDGLFHSFDHHGIFSGTNPDHVIRLINNALNEAHKLVKQNAKLIITLGTAFVYRHIDSGKIVANCHKFPNDQFKKELLSIDQIHESLAMIRQLLGTIQVLFTVSPVRHIKDGVVANQRSKARLIEAVHSQVEEKVQSYYFPSYEIMIDELRDYRFYREDLIHPNEQAMHYIWHQFTNAFFDNEGKAFLKDREGILQLVKHRSLHPGTPSDKQFKDNIEQKKERHFQKWGIAF